MISLSEYLMVIHHHTSLNGLIYKALPLYDRSTTWVPTINGGPHENLDLTHKSGALSNKNLQHHHFDI